MDEGDLLKEEELTRELMNGIQVICDRHGIVTNSSLYLRSSQFVASEDENETPKEHHSFFCLNCLHEYLSKLTDEGILGKTHLGVSKEVMDKFNLNEQDIAQMYERFQSQVSGSPEKEEGDDE